MSNDMNLIFIIKKKKLFYSILLGKKMYQTITYRLSSIKFMHEIVHEVVSFENVKNVVDYNENIWVSYGRKNIEMSYLTDLEAIIYEIYVLSWE